MKQGRACTRERERGGHELVGAPAAVWSRGGALAYRQGEEECDQLGAEEQLARAAQRAHKVQAGEEEEEEGTRGGIDETEQVAHEAHEHAAPASAPARAALRARADAERGARHVPQQLQED